MRGQRLTIRAALSIDTDIVTRFEAHMSLA